MNGWCIPAPYSAHFSPFSGLPTFFRTSLFKYTKLSLLLNFSSPENHKRFYLRNHVRIGAEKDETTIAFHACVNAHSRHASGSK